MSSGAPEGAVRLSLAVLRWFRDSAEQGFFTTDRDLRVVMWNRWLEIRTGRAAAEVAGRPLFELYPDIVERGLDRHFEEAFAGHTAVLSHGLHGYLLPMAARVGDTVFSPMPQHARIVPLVDGESVIGTLIVIEDVSERVASERELRKQIDAQLAATRAAEMALRAKDDFLATLSHEMRSPLNAVLGWTRILQNRELDPQLVARAVKVIDRNAALQARMIDDLLDMARIMAGKLRLQMQPVDLLAVTFAALDVVAPVAEAKRVSIRKSLDPKVDRVLGDPDRLQQVVWNLASNAVKFTDAGGTVEVRLEQVGRSARVIVRDTGRGISPEFLPFVFERFRQADSSSSRREAGLGLGLALVRDLVDLHGGSISVESAGEDQGSTFTVELPTLVSPEVRQNHLDLSVLANGEVPSLDSLRVLVVEDEADARDLLVTALSHCGARVTAAGSCAEALEVLLRPAGERPDVIVSDIGMAPQDGYALIRRVRALPPEQGGRTPAVAVTGYADPDDRARVVAAGYQAHVAKPADPFALALAVAKAARMLD